MALIESSPVSSSVRSLVSLSGGEDDRTVVWLRGEHDASTVDTLSEVMARAMALDDADLVVDLSGVQFMGAATVRAIAQARECLRGRSRALVLRSPSTCARRLVELCGLGHLVDPDTAVVPAAGSHRPLSG